MIKWYKKKVINSNSLNKKEYNIKPKFNISCWDLIFEKWLNYKIDEETYNLIKVFLN